MKPILFLCSEELLEEEETPPDRHDALMFISDDVHAAIKSHPRDPVLYFTLSFPFEVTTVRVWLFDPLNRAIDFASRGHHAGFRDAFFSEVYGNDGQRCCLIADASRVCQLPSHGDTRTRRDRVFAARDERGVSLLSPELGSCDCIYVRAHEKDFLIDALCLIAFSSDYIDFDPDSTEYENALAAHMEMGGTEDHLSAPPDVHFRAIENEIQKRWRAIIDILL